MYMDKKPKRARRSYRGGPAPLFPKNVNCVFCFVLNNVRMRPFCHLRNSLEFEYLPKKEVARTRLIQTDIMRLCVL